MRTARIILAAASLFLPSAAAQQNQDLPALSLCAAAPFVPACLAKRGSRAEGWPAQTRSEVMAPHAMVATSQPLAVQAGLQIMRDGGNAIDAAVTAAAVLNVTEPMSVGLGGDLFAIVYIAKDNRTYVLNASGMAVSGATIERMNGLGYHWNEKNWGPGSGMPTYGILAVTVPGSAWGWQEVLQRFGRKTFKEVLEPAIGYAENGFPISERIAADWKLPNALPLKECCTEPDPDSIKTWYIDGKRPVAGQIYGNPNLAKTLRLLQKGGRDVFYKGEIARAIVTKSQALGGTMTLEDLGNYKGQWTEAASTQYKGFTILELPPPSQAWAANEILNIVEACVPKWAPGQTLAALGPASPQYWHLLVEAKKLAYADLYAYNADPDFAKIPITRLLSKDHAESLCGKVDPNRASPGRATAPADLSGDTIVLSTADEEGNMVSWVNSNFSHFGSGITVPEYGFILHNRGALFTLDPKSPNGLAPHKRPFNTLSAGFVMKDSRPVMSVLLMGGDVQAQGHAQVLINIFELGANLQAASDMARFRHSQVSNRLELESELFQLAGAQLKAMGHAAVPADGSTMGGYQSILFTPLPQSPSSLKGYYRAGSDHRKDGQAGGW